MKTQPTLFVSHGAPTMALEPGTAGRVLAGLGPSLTKPSAILAVSAHWDTPAPAVSSASRPDTIHDFYGFPDALYRMTYPAPGAPALAARTADLLTQAGIPVSVDPRRGLDHGAWVPLQMMFPAADIPVTQLSVQGRLGAAHHFRVGEALAPLLSEDVLILASGNMTHNLREVQFSAPEGDPAPYVTAFQAWMKDALGRGDFASLVRYRELAPEAARAHPTEEHLLPLFVALGACGAGAKSVRLVDAVTYRVLAMDAYEFSANEARRRAA